MESIVVCPLCHQPHSDPPTVHRSRICCKCYDTALAQTAGPKPPAKKRRSKQTPKPIEETPPKTE